MAGIIDRSFIYGNDFNDSGVRPYTKHGAFLSEDQLSKFYKGVMNNLYLAIGAGNFNNSMQTILSKMDKFKTGFTPLNTEQIGLTFITRPRLNLSDGNIRQNRILATMDTGSIITGSHNVNNIHFMMRALLDTYFTEQHMVDAFKCPFLNPINPFFTPLVNCLTDINGWPDLILETETTEGGFHNENITFAKGSDMLNQSGELTLGFKDIQGGVILSILYTWVLYMALQNKGDVMAYEDDIYMQRLNYTVSIYRFMLDPSRRIITKWAKATGCFPKNVPIGASFNFNENDVTIDASRRFAIQFAFNKVEYNDSAIIRDFNRLMRRYVGGIDASDSGIKIVPNDLAYNYLGYPFIVGDDRGLRLEYRAYDSDITDYNDSVSKIDDIVAELRTTQLNNYENVSTPTGELLFDDPSS